MWGALGMATLRAAPYVWATWLADLLSGDGQCAFRAWFQSHHQYEKVPDEHPSRMAEYRAQHAKMVRTAAAEYRAAGYTVLLERQAQFRLVGQTGAMFAGKPDLVVVEPAGILVVECKSGKPADKHVAQVMLYQFALPLEARRNPSLAVIVGKPICGLVRYKDHPSVEVLPLTDTMRALIQEEIRRATGAAPPEKVPSEGECRWCPIQTSDCPERVEGAPAALPVEAGG